LIIQKKLGFLHSLLKTTDMLKKFLILTAVVLGSAAAQAQDPLFSQYYANPLYLNPAMAGSNVGARYVLNYRNQWPAIPGTFVSYSASFDQYIDAISGGIGVQAIADRTGESMFSMNGIHAMYSNNINLSRKWAIKTGLQAGYTNRSLNWDNLVFGDQIDARLGVVRGTLENTPIAGGGGVTSANYFDFAGGMLLYHQNFYGGVAAHHLTQPNETLLTGGNQEAALYVKWTAHAGGNIILRKQTFRNFGTSISPNVIYQHQGPFNTLNLGMYVNHGPAVGGVWYRQSGSTYDAFMVLMGVQKGAFKVGYSYDLTTSGLSTATSGSHEISISFAFEEKQKNKKRRVEKLKCPQF
jgi:type IX secretion system PorP/SprF family membrane protein